MSDPRVAGAPVKDIEYVYTSYHPTPKSPDEAQPNTGESIEAVVNDDPYGDGWLQVSPPRPFHCEANFPVLDMITHAEIIDELCLLMYAKIEAKKWSKACWGI